MSPRPAGFLFRWSVTTLLCVPLLMSCTAWTGRIHPDFVQTFIDVNRGSDDRAATVVYDSHMRLLAVGRESGRLELWDARKAGARIVREAHAVRTEHIAFGREDGIVLTNSVFDNSAIEAARERRSGMHAVAICCIRSRICGRRAPSRPSLQETSI